MTNEIATLAQEFIDKKIQPEASVNTVKAYKSDLKFLAERFSKLHEITQDSLRDLKLSMCESFSERTVARKWSAWREFLRYCEVIGLIKKNPIFQVKVHSPNSIRPLKQRLSAGMLEAICNSPDNSRDKALLWFLYSTGIRPSEIIREGIFKNLNLAAREFKIGNRMTFLCAKAYELLSEYISERATPPGLMDYIFVNEKGFPLTEVYIYSIFSSSAERLGLKANISDLRDSLVLRLKASGATLDELKYFLGFKSVKSIEPYLRLGANEIHENLLQTQS